MLQGNNVQFKYNIQYSDPKTMSKLLIKKRTIATFYEFLWKIKLYILLDLLSKNLKFGTSKVKTR